MDDGGVDDGAGGDFQPLLFKMAMRRLEDARTEIVRLQQVAEAADGGLVRGRLAPQIDAGEGARLPSLKGNMAAKKKPMATGTLADYGAAPAPVIKEVSVSLPPPRAAGQLVPDVPTLVKKLAEEAKVL